MGQYNQAGAKQLADAMPNRISWAYLIGDVSHESYKAYKRNQRILNPQTEEDQQFAAAYPGKAIPAIESPLAVGVQRATFQSIASMGESKLTLSGRRDRIFPSDVLH